MGTVKGAFMTDDKLRLVLTFIAICGMAVAWVRMPREPLRLRRFCIWWNAGWTLVALGFLWALWTGWVI